MKQENVISYRRRCSSNGQGTGLSHYIMLTPKKKTAKKEAGKQ